VHDADFAESSLTPQAHVASTGDSGRVLVVDDQKNMRATTAILLRAEGYTVDEASTGEEGCDAVSREPYDVVVTDLRMEPMDGLEFLRRVREASPNTQVVVMTAYGTIESAVEAMRRGAHDYLTKPFTEQELVVRVGKAMEKRRLLSQVSLYADDFRVRHGLSSIVGRSPPMTEVSSRIARVAAGNAHVLITGESGVGKELAARAVHALSRRADEPFVPVNCAALTETLLESELFGHARGAFTGAIKARRGLFEEADGGTLFIDEVSEAGPSLQAKLLRAIEEGEVRRVGESTAIHVDVRVVAATNQDLKKLTAEKKFREDLYYRLAVVTIRIPPLRERKEDIPLLAEHMLRIVNTRLTVRRRLTPAAIDHLMRYDFPGNVRELENMVEQAATMSDGDELGPKDFPFPDGPPSAEPGTGSLMVVAEEAERAAIASAIQRHGSDLGQVARDLQISSTTLWRKMRRYGLRAP
jgi:two-component system, NtrC family, response regulator HydG